MAFFYSLVMRYHSSSACPNVLTKGGPDTSYFYHLSTPFFAHQYKPLCVGQR